MTTIKTTKTIERAPESGVWYRIMLELKKMEEFNTADYEGFTLQKGFYYGRNLRGQAIATSGWVSEGAVLLYTKTEQGWAALWTDVDLFNIDFEEEVY